MHPKFLIPSLLASLSSAHCPRSFLESAVSAYLTSQLSGSTAPLASYLSISTPYTENAIPSTSPAASYLPPSLSPTIALYTTSPPAPPSPSSSSPTPQPPTS
ncbi:hypothetical protein GRF29_164g236037 [Pseudopithomyces chartarum]|uniref:Uncharacterized protein n=1 Tax=Pseudopithomyces chartarum TaxID=1892770 RepID=A0AAN6LT56_9PLEO|nr:hypothetical protein GRF29_164g236037 [Pseudopithomyces chartarum]